MTKRKLRKNADISPPQSPHDGIHTCSRGCKKPGCTRTLRETIEEQDQQIEALKRDVLEKTTEIRNLKEVVHELRISAEDDLDSIETARFEIARLQEHNEALCERMQDLNSEVFAASNINGKLHMKRVHDLNQMGGQCEEIARLKAEVEELKSQPDPLTAYLYADTLRRDDIKTLKAHIERLTKAGDAMADRLMYQGYPATVPGWNAAKEGKQS
jgi:chromosome segregation ATPase